MSNLIDPNELSLMGFNAPPQRPKAEAQNFSVPPYSIRVNYQKEPSLPHNNFITVIPPNEEAVGLGSRFSGQPVLMTRRLVFPSSKRERDVVVDNRMDGAYSSEYQNDEEAVQLISYLDGEKNELGSMTAAEAISKWPSARVEMILYIYINEIGAVRRLHSKKAYEEAFFGYLAQINLNGGSYLDKEITVEALPQKNKDKGFVYYQLSIKLKDGDTSPVRKRRFYELGKELRKIIYSGEIYRASAETGLKFQVLKNDPKENKVFNKEEYQEKQELQNKKEFYDEEERQLGKSLEAEVIELEDLPF